MEQIIAKAPPKLITAVDIEPRAVLAVHNMRSANLTEPNVAVLGPNYSKQTQL